LPAFQPLPFFLHGRRSLRTCRISSGSLRNFAKSRVFPTLAGSPLCYASPLCFPSGSSKRDPFLRFPRLPVKTEERIPLSPGCVTPRLHPQIRASLLFSQFPKAWNFSGHPFDHLTSPPLRVKAFLTIAGVVWLRRIAFLSS